MAEMSESLSLNRPVLPGIGAMTTCSSGLTVSLLGVTRVEYIGQSVGNINRTSRSSVKGPEGAIRSRQPYDDDPVLKK